ncbi:hypothetical protein [Kamptonema formosum]|uniref:hypothetical protein n=1 Tax=Kamptonema formosum TaxID=331992 RepID=UPI00034C8D57
MLSALAQQPAVLGFGIDENTAVVIDGNQFQVFGGGAVTVVDISEISHCNLEELLKDEALAICGAKLHILPQEYRFDLEKRVPIFETAAAQAA